VRYFPVAGEPEFVDTVTRSEAWELGHGAIVVLVAGISGGVLVGHLAPLAICDIDGGRFDPGLANAVAQSISESGRRVVVTVPDLAEARRQLLADWPDSDGVEWIGQRLAHVWDVAWQLVLVERAIAAGAQS